MEPLASTKPVNDADFAMQFIGGVMRVAREIRRAFPKPVVITKDGDKLRVVEDDGSLGAIFDWDDLGPAWEWMASNAPHP